MDGSGTPATPHVNVARLVALTVMLWGGRTIVAGAEEKNKYTVDYGIRISQYSILLTSPCHSDEDTSRWNSCIRDLYISSATVLTRILRSGAVYSKTTGDSVESSLSNKDIRVNLESGGGVYKWSIILK